MRRKQPRSPMGTGQRAAAPRGVPAGPGGHTSAQMFPPGSAPGLQSPAQLFLVFIRGDAVPSRRGGGAGLRVCIISLGFSICFRS